jgi:hypothetical protein
MRYPMTSEKTSPTSHLTNVPDAVRRGARDGAIPLAAPLGMTFARIILFVAYQSLAALVCLLAGRTSPWQAAIAWWPATVTAANITCLALLRWLAGRERLRLRDLYNFDRRSAGRDLLVVLGLLVVGGPLGYVPSVLLGRLLFGSAEAVADRWILPLPAWAAIAFAILFPLTIALSELPSYFGYALPRLQALWNRRWAPVLLAAFMLGAQHIALPLVFDARFMLWRAASFLPFALYLSLLLNWRPRLLPYLMVVHGLMDASLVAYVLTRSLPAP